MSTRAWCPQGVRHGLALVACLCMVAAPLGCFRMSPGVLNPHVATSSDIAGVRSTAPTTPSALKSPARVFPAAPDTTQRPAEGPVRFRPQDVPHRWRSSGAAATLPRAKLRP